MISERQRNCTLDTDLDRFRKRSKYLYKACSVKSLPPNKGRSSICGEICINGPRKGDASDSVCCRTVPGQLRLVDAQMRSNGSLFSLSNEKLVGFGIGGVNR